MGKLDTLLLCSNYCRSSRYPTFRRFLSPRYNQRVISPRTCYPRPNSRQSGSFQRFYTKRLERGDPYLCIDRNPFSSRIVYILCPLWLDVGSCYFSFRSLLWTNLSGYEENRDHVWN